MKKTRCYIIGAGEYSESAPPGDKDFVIAADGGYSSLTKLGIVPDLVIGDFDSLGKPPKHPNIIRSNTIKDDTDMMLAVKTALGLGYTDFLLNGGQGGRLDHTYANIQTLVYLAENNARGVLAGNKMSATVIKNSKLTLTLPSKSGKDGSIASVFSCGGTSHGVTLEGFRYTLKDAAITDSFPIGVSNEIIASCATVEVKSGILVVIFDSHSALSVVG